MRRIVSTPTDWQDVPGFFSGNITFPWEVPPETIVVERTNDGFWRVVPHGRAVLIFETREEAVAWARMVAALYIPIWKIVEREPPATEAVA